jgi:UPF0176 protein
MGAILGNAMEPPFQILLYYLYTSIDDPEAYAEEQRELCERLGLRGRIIVAGEGINGTVSGETEGTAKYMQAMGADPRTAEMTFKVDPAEGHAFKKLSVKAREEIVSLNLGEVEDIDPKQLTGNHLSPAEFKEAMRDEEAIILDGRNNYESDLGRFKGAICPDLDNFRDFPQWIRENLGDAKDRPLLTYCTGGIRCEKLSGFLVKEGFRNVAQLEGGIVSYGKDPEVLGEDFEGECYVFDERIGVEVNHKNSSVVAACRSCGQPSERYVNCAHQACNLRIFVCEACEESAGRFCSAECRCQVQANSADIAAD